MVIQWEDKLLFLALPLLVLFLLNKGRSEWAAAVTGASITFNGVLVFFAPIVMLYAWKRKGRNAWKDLLVLVVAASVVMLPFLPESLDGWEKRAARMSADSPFWFSLYLLLPPGWYFPALDKILVVSGAALTALAYATGHIRMVTAMIASVFWVVMFGPYNGIQRVLPIVILVAFLTPGLAARHWTVLAMVLYGYFMLTFGFSPANITPLHALLFWLPIAGVFGLFTFQRLRVAPNRPTHRNWVGSKVAAS